MRQVQREDARALRQGFEGKSEMQEMQQPQAQAESEGEARAEGVIYSIQSLI
jgi:hypothetical protein